MNPTRPQEVTHLTIFHTNDMHGRLEAIARLNAYARRLRTEAELQGRQVFFWDAGDAADRRIRICSLTKGAAFAHVLNAMGYSLQSMGNAISVTYGPQAMQALAARCDFPILAANFRNAGGPVVEGFHEYVLLPLPGGLHIGVIGLTAELDNFYELFGLRFPHFLDVTRELVSKLREAGADLIAVLSHLGLREDRQMAEAVPGIDLIIGGHSHSTLPEGEETAGVLIAQAGEYAKALGRVDLSLDAATGRLLARSAQVLDVPEDEAPDPAVLEAIAVAEREVGELMVQPVGVLQAGLDLDHFQECAIGDLAADALRQRMQAEVAIVSSGQFHRDLPLGTITMGQLDEACFSTANPAVSEVRGANIITALERGLDPAVNRFEFGGLRGTPLGIPQISGLQVEYDPGAETGARVRRVLVQGRLLDPERLYRLAHTDVEAVVDPGYRVVEDDRQPRYELPTILREVLQDYICEHSPVPQPERGRWVAIT